MFNREQLLEQARIKGERYISECSASENFEQAVSTKFIEADRFFSKIVGHRLASEKSLDALSDEKQSMLYQTILTNLALQWLAIKAQTENPKFISDLVTFIIASDEENFDCPKNKDEANVQINHLESRMRFPTGIEFDGKNNYNFSFNIHGGLRSISLITDLFRRSAHGCIDESLESVFKSWSDKDEKQKAIWQEVREISFSNGRQAWATLDS